MKNIIPLLFLIFYVACTPKNDYRITEERAGWFEMGAAEQEVSTLLKGYEVKTYKSGFLPDFIKFKTVSKKGKPVMHLSFSGNKLDGIKVYDQHYITGSGIKIGHTAQNAIDKGMSNTLIHFGNREGLLCELAEKNITGKVRRLRNLQFIFERQIYQDGSMRNIGRFAELKCFVIGKYFDIKMDTLNDAEKKVLSNYMRGSEEGNTYANNYYGITMNIPADWKYESHFGSTEDYINLLWLKNSNNQPVLSLDLQERSNARDGSSFLDRLGLQGKIEHVKGPLYRKRVILQQDTTSEIYYSMVANGNCLLLRGKGQSEDELAEIEKIVMTIKSIRPRQNLRAIITNN